MEQFHNNNKELLIFINKWVSTLLLYDNESITSLRNSQNRNIKQILGHMIDSVSNNTHRVVHLQYQKSPFTFPNYATFGNNDKWISIQNYQQENWKDLIMHWKFSHLHFIHVVNNVDTSKTNNLWISEESEMISLKEIILDFLRHFKLHMNEIEILTNNLKIKL